MAVKRYNGTSWDTVAGLGAQGPAATSSSITTWVKTATGGETSLTGSSDSSTTLAYTPGQEQLFINGVLQVRGSDYTATNGTSITGLTALVAGDIATVTTVNAFSVTGAVPLSTVTANGDLIVGTSSGAVGRLGIGSTDQVLKVSGGVPTWATPAAGGAFTLIATATPSAASTFSFTSIPATYKHLFVLVPELRWAATGQSVKMRFATGSYYSTRAIGTLDNSGTFSYITERGEPYFGTSNQGGAPIQKGYTSAGVFGDISSASAIWIYDYTNTADRVVTWTAGGNGGAFQGIGIYDHTAVISNIDFQTTGSTVTGTAYLYGVN